MISPSLQLLRALRATEFIRHTTRTHRIPTCSTPLHPFPKPASPAFSTTSRPQSLPPSKSSDRGPPSKEDTQTDFGSMNVLGNTPPPTTAIDACLSDGFHLDNGLKIGGGSGCLLVAGEAFSWRPWEAGRRESGSAKGRMVNRKGQWDVEREAWGVLDLVWPKPGMFYFLLVWRLRISGMEGVVRLMAQQICSS